MMKANLSYWELKNWFSNIDFAVVGSGIVGLHAALRLREKFPESKILILEEDFCRKERVLKMPDLPALAVFLKL